MNYANRIPQIVGNEEVSRLWSCAADPEEFLKSMRLRGATKIESIRALRHEARMSLEHAKKLVHFSPTWADRREADEEFHEAIATLLEETRAVKV